MSQLSGTPTLAELASTNLARTKSAVAMNAVAVIVAMVTTMYAVFMVELLVAHGGVVDVRWLAASVA